MIINTADIDKELRYEINKMVGRPFSVRAIMKIGTIGSSRMPVTKYSKRFMELLSSTSDTVFASIGLRPKGIIVMVSKSHNNFSWIIAYHHLSVFKTDTLNIHAGGEHLNLLLKQDQNQKFIKKLLERKEAYMQNPSSYLR